MHQLPGSHEQTALQRRIAAKGRQIDALVRELYALAEEEIGIVESGGINGRHVKLLIKSIIQVILKE